MITQCSSPLKGVNLLQSTSAHNFITCTYSKVCIRLRHKYFRASTPEESSLSSIIFDDVEEHDSVDSFFCGETDITTKDTRTAHGQVNRDECNQDGEENRDEQTSTK